MQIAAGMVGLLTSLLLPAGAHAEGLPSGSASEHLERGQQLYRAGRPETALSEYVSAYELSLNPDYLIDIAKCHRKLGHHDAAVFYYQGYLAWRPDGPARAEVEREIAEVQAEQAAANVAR